MTSDAAVFARLGLQQIGTFQLIPSSGVSASKRAAKTVKLAGSSLLVEPRMILPSRISPGPRNQDKYEIAAARERLTKKPPTRYSPAAQLGKSQATSL